MLKIYFILENYNDTGSVFNIFTLGLSGALFVSYMLLSGSE